MKNGLLKMHNMVPTENFDEIEWQLNEDNFKLSPQPISLVETLPTAPTDSIYRIQL